MSKDAQKQQQQEQDEAENIKTIKRSVITLRLAIFVDTANMFMLLPNYAIMADSTANPESFASTHPFNFASATYFIPMTALFGVAIASLLTGSISDRIGRKPVILFCLAGSTLGSIAKWFCRRSFWLFCAANFVNGLLSGSLPVALAYLSDIFPDEEAMQREFSLASACYVLGQGGGTIFAVAMYPLGLFAPLWLGAGCMFAVCCLCFQYLIDPKELSCGNGKEPNEENDHDDEEIEERWEEDFLPPVIDKIVPYLIIIGGIVNTFGSRALYPLCVAPLAFNVFYKDYTVNGEPPILSLRVYQLLLVFIPFMVVPSALVAPVLYRKIGYGITCILGNIFTGVLTIVLIMITKITPQNTWTAVGFAAALHIGFPLSALSHLTTSMHHLHSLYQHIFVALFVSFLFYLYLSCTV